MNISASQIKNLLFIDIETVSGEKSFDLLSDRFKNMWKHKCISLDKEELYTIEELYQSKAAIYAEFGKIVCISVGFLYYNSDQELSLKTKSYYGDDEKEILLSLKELLEVKYENKEVRFCAHNGKEFDYPYISRRMLINGIIIPTTLDIAQKKPWEINHLDTLEMWKFGDRKSYTSLELLATVFDLPTSKDEMDGSMVGHYYYQEKSIDKIATYCQKDVILTAMLYLKIKTYNTPLSSNIFTENYV